MGSLPRVLALVATVVLTLQVGGGPLGSEGGCPCDAEEEAHAPSATMSDSAGDHARDAAHESCPPDCDDCPCCGGASSFATASPTTAEGTAVATVEWLSALQSSPPRGERLGVFRPPRA